MNQYEVMYVIDAALEDSARAELINRFSDLVKKNGGEVDRVDEWGKRHFRQHPALPDRALRG